MEIVRTLINYALALITSAFNLVYSYLNYRKLNLNQMSAELSSVVLMQLS